MLRNLLATQKNLRNRKNKNLGFTLIEMLVVVLIMGILLAVAIPLYLSSVKTANDNTAQGNLKTLGTAAAAYNVKHGQFPTMEQLVTEGDVADPSVDGKVEYSVAGSTADDFVITATAPNANTFTNGTTWTYTAKTGALAQGAGAGGGEGEGEGV